MGTDAMRKADLCGRFMVDFVAERFTFTGENGACRPIAYEMLRNGHFWAAVEQVKPCGARFVWIGLALTGHYFEGDTEWVTWKMMTEHMGPTADDCPRRIFGLVTEFDDRPSYGLDWRARVAAKLGVPLPGAQLALI